MGQHNKIRDMRDGILHWVKILLESAGVYMQWSRFEDALIETEVLGKLTLNSLYEDNLCLLLL